MHSSMEKNIRFHRVWKFVVNQAFDASSIQTLNFIQFYSLSIYSLWTNQIFKGPVSNICKYCLLTTKCGLQPLMELATTRDIINHSWWVLIPQVVANTTSVCEDFCDAAGVELNHERKIVFLDWNTFSLKPDPNTFEVRGGVTYMINLAFSLMH